MTNEPVTTFACKSSAVHSTVVFPSGNVEPDAGEQVTGTEPSTASTAVTLYVTTESVEMMRGGRFNTGPTVSLTKMLNVPSATGFPNPSLRIAPRLSVTSHVTTVVPIE